MGRVGLRIGVAVTTIGLVTSTALVTFEPFPEVDRAARLTSESMTALMNPRGPHGEITFDDAPLSPSSFDLYSTSWSVLLVRELHAPMPGVISSSALRARVRHLIAEDGQESIFEQEQLYRLAHAMGVRTARTSTFFRRFAADGGYSTSAGGRSDLAANVVVLRNTPVRDRTEGPNTCGELSKWWGASSSRTSQESVDRLIALALILEPASSCTDLARRAIQTSFRAVSKQQTTPQSASALVDLRQAGISLGISLPRLPISYFSPLDVGSQYSTSPAGPADPQMTYNVAVLTGRANAHAALSSLEAGAFRQGWIGLHGRGDALVSYLGRKVIDATTAAVSTPETVESLSAAYALCATREDSAAFRGRLGGPIRAALRDWRHHQSRVVLAEIAATAAQCGVSLPRPRLDHLPKMATAGDALSTFIIGQSWGDRGLGDQAREEIRRLTKDGLAKWSDETTNTDLLSTAIARKILGGPTSPTVRVQAIRGFSRCGVWTLTRPQRCSRATSGILATVAADALLDRENRATATDLLFAFAH